MSIGNSENGVTPYEPLLNAEEVYCILLHKLGVEKEKLENHARIAENAEDVELWNDIKGSDPSESLVNLKTKVYKAMEALFNSQQASSIHSYDRYLEEKVTYCMKEHCERNEALISYLDNDLKTVQRLTKLTKNQTKDLEVNLMEKQAKNNLSKEEQEADFKRKEELVVQKHRKLIRAVRAVTRFANPERHGEMNDILGALLAKSFEPNSYINEEPGWEELVEFLLLTDMVVRHPDDKRKIRLVDFM